MKKQTKKQNKTKRKHKRNTHKRNTHKRKTHKRKQRNHHVKYFIPKNLGQGQGHGHILFSMPEKQKSLKIIVDNNDKQFGNIIPGLREM